MSIASFFNSTLKISRCLQEEEIQEFLNLTEVPIKSFYVNNRNILPYGKEYIFRNEWIIKDKELTLKQDKPEIFLFIETLDTLLKIFFFPKNIEVKGTISGYEDLFGESFYYYVDKFYIYTDDKIVDEMNNLNLKF